MHNPDLLAKGLKCGLQSSGHFGEVFCHRYVVYNWEKQEGKNEEAKRVILVKKKRSAMLMCSFILFICFYSLPQVGQC